jgi:hypothetical protein
LRYSSNVHSTTNLFLPLVVILGLVVPVMIQVLKPIISPDCSYIRNMMDNSTPQANALPCSVGGAQIEMLKTFCRRKLLNIHKRLLELCALVLGKALLWFIYCNHAVSSNIFPSNSEIRSRTS